MTASNRKCINAGGPLSRIHLPSVPQLNQEVDLDLTARAALRSWGARVGEIFTVCDPQQQQYRARVTALAEGSARVFPFAKLPPMESPVAINIFQALPEKERFEFILQKATELGASRIIPYTCSRSATLAERDAGQKKSHRWPNVLLRAARQCRRAEIPELYPVLDWQQAVNFSTEADLALLCYEGEGTQPIETALRLFSGKRVALVVGPEGGFKSEEAEQAKQQGVLPIGLGPRILRTETAAIVAAGIIQYALGDLGRG